MCKVELDEEVVLYWDHYKPISKGGHHVVDNLRPACAACNLRKSATWPISESRIKEISEEVIMVRNMMDLG
ncbi:HNH endonuclease [Streptosporangium sp. NBC_01495]|uniref:HNH endonuclease n=1 Tax=Streptosporangium sp. NBC_01495 TaxID=2903899 RepID=UPI003FCC6A15